MAKAKRKAAASRKSRNISFPIQAGGAVLIEPSDRPVTDSTFGGMLKRLFAVAPESTAAPQPAKKKKSKAKGSAKRSSKRATKKSAKRSPKRATKKSAKRTSKRAAKRSAKRTSKRRAK